LGIDKFRPVRDVKKIEIVGGADRFRAADHRPILWCRRKGRCRSLKEGRAGAEKGCPHKAGGDAESDPTTHCLLSSDVL
jgi:hypothetical protein